MYEADIFDACYIVGGELLKRSPILPENKCNYWAELKKYYHNWERLINENVQMIYPAHGKPFGIEKLKNNLHRNREEQMVKVEE